MKRFFSIVYFALFTTIFFSSGASAAIQCNQCHGTSGPADYRPLDSPYRNISTGGFKGNHRRHMGTTISAVNCNPCHGNGVNVSTYLVNHRNKSIDMVVNINNSPKLGGATYSKGVFFNQTSTPITGTCANTNCHFESTTLAWESAPFTTPNDCNKCHGVPPNGGGTGIDGSHTRHEIYYPGTTNCQKCHANNTTFAHATSAGKRNLNISFAAAPNNGSGTYSGALNDYLPSQTNNFGTCSATYCHSSGTFVSTGTISANTSPVWGTTGPLACTSCHGYPPAYASGSPKANSHAKHSVATCDKCHNSTTTNGTTITATGPHANKTYDVVQGAGISLTYSFATGGGTCSNVSCHYNSTTPAWGSTINCFGCHTLAQLQASGSHEKHISSTLIPTMYNYTANRSTSGEYNFGCSNCHPLALSNHTNGTINITLKNNEAGVGSLRTKNSATAAGINVAGSGITGTTKTNIVCTAAYCHSNGNAAALVYATTPNWYGGSFTGDRCANCHGNAPNNTIAGSASHYNNKFLGYTSTVGGHQIGIHAMKIYSSPGNVAHAGSTGSSSHGNAATSTTISCNTCHYNTVTTARNDSNAVCVICHYSGNTAGAQSGNLAAIANRSKHVNGAVDIAFQPVTILSKAQMRAASFNLAPYSSAWKRAAGYKVTGAYDSAKAALNTSSMWNGSTKTCANVACHNGQSVKWGDNNGTTSCISCHTAL